MTTITSENNYIRMQLNYYNQQGIKAGEGMDKENHVFHNKNPDYFDILVKDTEEKYNDKIGLDFGCGCGRNIINLSKRFKRFDGVDISPNLIKRTRENLIKNNITENDSKLFVCNGVNLDIINSNEYDFIMSTIVLQHICVYDIRFSYLKEFYRLLKSGGLLSFQMGYGIGHGKVNYYDNYYDATETNSKCDVIVDDPKQIINDLTNIGFINIRYYIKNSFFDNHPYWIYIKAEK